MNGNDGPSRVRNRESNTYLVDQIQFGWSLPNVASHVILCNCNVELLRISTKM